MYVSPLSALGSNSLETLKLTSSLYRDEIKDQRKVALVTIFQNVKK